MATESQMDLWRRNVRTNLNKAFHAALEDAANNPEIPSGEIGPRNRMRIALASANAGSLVMISERLGQLIQALTAEDEQMADMAERIRTGEKIMQRFIDAAPDIETMDNPDEAMVIAVTMMEDWLNPGGIVNFATDESVEAGTDQQSKELSDLERQAAEAEPEKD